MSSVSDFHGRRGRPLAVPNRRATGRTVVDGSTMHSNHGYAPHAFERFVTIRVNYREAIVGEGNERQGSESIAGQRVARTRNGHDHIS